MLVAPPTSRTPLRLITAHFVVGFLSLLVAAIALVIFGHVLSGHYFQPALLGLTHLVVLGWITTVIFGVSYQIIPVLADKSLYSVKLAALTLALHAGGAAILAASFFSFRLGPGAIAGAVMVLAAFLLYTFNILKTWTNPDGKSPAHEFVLIALVWLCITAVFGCVLLLNLRFAFLSVSHLEMLKLHAHFGCVGWLVLLVMGVASKLLPMFMLSDRYNRNLLRVALYAINAGLLMFIILVVNKTVGWMLLPALFIALGIASYLAFVYQVVKHRVRKNLDEGLRKSRLAFLLLCAPVGCGIWLAASGHADTEGSTRLAVFYGFSFLFGFVTLLVMAQTFKTLPFLVWSEHYAGKIAAKEVLPKDLYSENLVKLQFVFFLLSYLLFVLAFVFSLRLLFETAALFFLFSILIYGINLVNLLLPPNARLARR
jgi:hypothetical protein